MGTESLPVSKVASSDLSTTRSPSSVTHQRTSQSAKTTTHSWRTESSPRRGGSRLTIIKSRDGRQFFEKIYINRCRRVLRAMEKIFGDQVDLPHHPCNFAT